MSDRLTLATATGVPLLSLVFHVVMGVAALLAGYAAIASRKGGRLHRRSGVVFVAAMVAMGLSAVGIALYEGKEDVADGAAAAYLVLTAWTTVRPLRGAGRGADLALMLLPVTFAVSGIARGITALGRPGNHLDGVPAAMLFFLSTIYLLAAIGDARMILGGRLEGARRLARHLWRMCFGLFIASGSFVAQLVMMTFMPAWMRSVPVIVLLSAAPLVVLLYWMGRVRLRRNLRDLMTAKPVETPRLATGSVVGSASD